MGCSLHNAKGEDVAHTYSPFLSSVRQIAHEVFRSLDALFPNQLEIDKYYDIGILEYKTVGHNHRKLWTLVVPSQKFDEEVNSFHLQFMNNDNTTVIGFSSKIKSPYFDVENLEYAIVGNANGKITVREKGHVYEDISEYAAGDRFGLVIAKSKEELKVFYLQNEKVIFVSQTTPSLSMHLNIAMLPNCTVGYPQVGKNQIISYGILKDGL
jgi:hypothetical protein